MGVQFGIGMLAGKATNRLLSNKTSTINNSSSKNLNTTTSSNSKVASLKQPSKEGQANNAVVTPKNNLVEFSGHTKPWTTNAKPNSIYRHIDESGKGSVPNCL